MAENQIFTDDEITLIEASAPYQDFVKAHPEAGTEDFIKGRIEASRAFGIARKYNKKLEPMTYFGGMKEIQRRQMLGEWLANPEIPLYTQPESKVETIDKDNNENTAVSAEKPVIKEDTVIAKPEMTEDTMKPEPQTSEKGAQRSRGKNPDAALKSDRRINFKSDETFLAFMENLPGFKEDFEASALDGLETSTDEYRQNLEKRQKIVDYFRFMEGGKKSREAIQSKNWEFLDREYKNFPKAPNNILFSIYNGNLDKNGPENTPRSERLQRTIIYRFEDMQSGKWRIGKDEELKEIEDFIKTVSEKNPEFAEALSAAAQRIIADYKARKAERDAYIKQRQEEAARKSREQAEALKLLEENKVSEQSKEGEDTKIETISKPVIKENNDKEDIIVTFNQILEETAVNHQEKTDDEKKEKKQENIIINQDVPAVENEIKSEEQKEEISKPHQEPVVKEAEEKKEEIKTSAWEDEIERGWKEYGEKHYKKVDVAKEPGKVVVNVFEDEDKVKTQSPEAKIIYDGPDKISVGGRGDDIPDLSIFENIVAQSKKVSTKFRFGNIKDAEFKAKLMIACLRDAEIKIINGPSEEELKDIKPELKEILEAEMEKRGLKEGSTKGLDKSREAREKINNREDRGDKGYGRRKNYDDNNNGERRPYKKHQYTKEEISEYKKKKLMADMEK